MASARKVHELGSVMNTESDQSSENRHQVSPPAENSQHAGTTGWNEPAGLVPSWSVPPGPIVPSPRSTVDDSADDDSAVDDSAVDDSAVDDSAWPGIAAPAGWFLRVQAAPAASIIPPATPPAPPAAPPASPVIASTAVTPITAVPGLSPAPATTIWRIKSVPSPHRGPDGSWSSPLTPPE